MQPLAESISSSSSETTRHFIRKEVERAVRKQMEDDFDIDQGTVQKVIQAMDQDAKRKPLPTPGIDLPQTQVRF